MITIAIHHNEREEAGDGCSTRTHTPTHYVRIHSHITQQTHSNRRAHITQQTHSYGHAHTTPTRVQAEVRGCPGDGIREGIVHPRGIPRAGGGNVVRSGAE